MRVFQLLIFLACTGFSAHGAASFLTTPTPARSRPLSLEQCVQLALEHNFDIQIRRLDPGISRFNLRAAYGVYDPLVNIAGSHSSATTPGGYDDQGRQYPANSTDRDSISAGLGGTTPWGMSYNVDGAGTDAYGSGRENASGQLGLIDLNQPLLRGLWTDRNRLQIYVNRSNLRISELELRDQIHQTLTDVEQSYYNLMFLQENIKVQQTALELADRLLTENRKRVEVGALAPLDEKQAEAQAASTRADLLEAQGREDTQQRVLKNLLSDNYSEWASVHIEPTATLLAVPQYLNLQESWRNGLSMRPDLQQQRIRLLIQNEQIRYNKNLLLPQVNAFGTYGYNGSAREFPEVFRQFRDRDNPAWSAGGRLTMPLTWTTERNTYRASKLTKDQITLALRQMEQGVLIQIENAMAVVKTSQQRVEATREAGIYAAAALDAEQKKLASGKSTSFAVLRLQRDLTTARSDEIRSLADYNIALAQLALNEGTTLERRQVNLEVR